MESKRWIQYYKTRLWMQIPIIHLCLVSILNWNQTCHPLSIPTKPHTLTVSGSHSSFTQQARARGNFSCTCNSTGLSIINLIGRLNGAHADHSSQARVAWIWSYVMHEQMSKDRSLMDWFPPHPPFFVLAFHEYLLDRRPSVLPIFPQPESGLVTD